MGLKIIPEERIAFCDRCKEESGKSWNRFSIKADTIKNIDNGGSYAQNLFPQGIDLCEKCMLDLKKFMNNQ